ncbi:MAG: 16S rRNA (guanine(966)-N(2))-methyltransferase RsmD [Candidatus Hinthialibacter antarcticus]|nr:16S rRNA (guanine(966)-N(2))-methyltransferase RsmD [Candidatus Hinthialibacter antarcticus]
MRIIAGKYKNRAIETPEGLTTRPLLSRIRKSLFGILEPHLAGARILDCFSGSGMIAMESFSRGASYVMSIDIDPKAIATAKANHKKICPDAEYYTTRGDVLEMLPRLAQQNQPYDLIGVMPPFGQKLVTKTMEIIDAHPSLLTPDAIVFVQRDIEEEISLEWKTLEHVRTKKYGRNIFEFFMPPEVED